MEAATQVKENLDLSVSPCDDFYQYSCGNFIERTIIPADRGSETMFHLTSEKVLNQVGKSDIISSLQLRSILEEPSNSSQPEIYRMVKTVYSVCTDTRALEGRAVGGFSMSRRVAWSRQSRC